MNDNIPLSQPSERALWLISSDSHVALGLENECLFAGTVDASRVREVRKAFDDGTSAEALIKDKSNIPLEVVQQIQANVAKPIIEILYQPDKKSQQVNYELACKNMEEQQSVMDELEQKLGEEWERETRTSNRWQLAILPLACLAFASFLAFCMYMVATGQDNSTGGTKTVRTNAIGIVILAIIQFLGPAGALVVFLIAIAVILVWLLAVLIKPPVYDTLSKT